MSDVPPAGIVLAARLYVRPWRLVAAILFALSRVSLVWILWLLVTADDPPLTPPLLARVLLILVVLPGAAAWLIGRAFAGRVALAGVAPQLIVERPGQRLVLPAGELAAPRPWRLPLPEAGFDLMRGGGVRLSWSVAAADPTPLVAGLGGDPGQPMLRYAQARAAVARGWRYWLGRYVVFALLPAAVLFNAHQYIAYGGTLGQYYLLGPRAWLTTAAVYWATTGAYLLLWASLWRGGLELLAWLAAWPAPQAAPALRRAVEWIDRAAFYGGSLAILALRFLA
ncbi:MAG: hypothetical protein ABI629_22095 [bacterium]